MAHSDRVAEILGWYSSDCPGTKANLVRLLGQGRLGGTGSLVVLPADQGFELGPHRSFARNPEAQDPHYHFDLALRSGCSALAAPLGFLEAGADRSAGLVPTILMLNGSDALFKDDDPEPAVTADVEDALRLGCSAVGFTIHPGSESCNSMYQDLQEIVQEAKEAGLAVLVRSSARGSGISGKGETAVDVVAYSAQIACQMGAHLVELELPGEHLEQGSARKLIQSEKIPVATLADRVRHVVQSAFGGRRLVLFSAQATRDGDALLEEARAVHEGGGHGFLVGRGPAQAGAEPGAELIHRIQDVFTS